MPLRAARVGRVGVIGHPVAKTAVVAKAVSPGPSPVAKTAVVAAAVTPGRAGTVLKNSAIVACNLFCCNHIFPTGRRQKTAILTPILSLELVAHFGRGETRRYQSIRSAQMTRSR